MSFFSIEAGIRIKKNNPLLKIHALIDWESIGKILRNYREYSGGQKPYDSVKMFKAVLLGQWYNLSDEELENSLNLRMDFMFFSGFELLESYPDHTTLCRFRCWVVEKKLDQLLFAEINRQLEEKNLKVKNCAGSIIDATLVESQSRPRRVIEEIPQDRQEECRENETKDTGESSQTQTRFVQEESKDPDARWLKKGKKCYFGYKVFARVDSQDGYIEQVIASPANLAEVKFLPQLCREKIGRLFGDKAYDSRENQEYLKSVGVKNGILKKASRNHPLSKREKKRNVLISKIRYKVEQTFGTLKRKFKFVRASYVGLAKVEGQALLKASCYNLLKAANRLKLDLDVGAWV